MKRILIIQGQMKRYRVPFFTQLSQALRHDGICLTVAYSDPKQDGSNDTCDLPPGVGLKVKGHWMFGRRILWQPLLREIFRSDFVITEEANKYVLTHVLAVLSMLRLKRVAIWGLGENKNEDRSEISEWLRRRILKRVDWWFAYTRTTADYLIANKFPADRIVTVHNAVDTAAFSGLLESISSSEVSAVKRRFGIQANGPVALFCGLLIPDKGISFLLESAKMIRSKMPDFHLFILGGGTEKEKVEAAAGASCWIHYLGPKFDEEKAMFFRLADVFLLPGRVGLAILDAFAAGLPLLTIDVSYHGPEIEYLEHGRNGIMTDPDPAAYAERVVGLCSDPKLLGSFRQHATESSNRASIETMVENFRAGIRRALSPYCAPLAPSRDFSKTEPILPQKLVIGSAEREAALNCPAPGIGSSARDV